MLVFRSVQNDMYLLNPKDRKPDWDKSHGGFGYDKTTSHFTSGFIMAPINARVSDIRLSSELRSHATADFCCESWIQPSLRLFVAGRTGGEAEQRSAGPRLRLAFPLLGGIRWQGLLG